MTAPAPPSSTPLAGSGVRGLGFLALLGAALVFFALLSGLAWFLGLPIVAAGMAAAFLLRRRDAPRDGRAAPIPALGALVAVAAFAPSSPESDLVGGFAAVALLAWLADDPRRAPGGLSRALPSLVLVLVTLGIAWVGAFLLPSGSALIGIGAGLLVVVMILVAVLLGRPDLIDREPPATA
jgi:hypothetical protein